MYNPFVVRASDGTWRALWSLNSYSPQFAVAYSEDLLTWRPQDYPIVKEKGITEVAACEVADGNFDIYLKTSSGKRCVWSSRDFRTFKEDTQELSANDTLWQRDVASINGKDIQGCRFDIHSAHLKDIRQWFKKIAREKEENIWQVPKTESELNATIEIQTSKTHRISDKLIGVFFEDISRAADGGLNAEMLQNGDFEYNKEDRKQKWNATTAWEGIRLTSDDKVEAAVSVENGVSQNNPHYAILSSEPVYNIGWDGFAVKQNADYNVCLYARNIDVKKKILSVALVDNDRNIIAQTKLKVSGREWTEYKTKLAVNGACQGKVADSKGIRFAILPEGKGKVAVDLVSLKPTDTYKRHGLRKDLAELIADLHPRFVRFPGGCMLHGQGLDNIYHWKESIGPLKDRKPALNIWRYHQTRQLGFYEYFQCQSFSCSIV